jgi:hypothetical protein
MQRIIERIRARFGALLDAIALEFCTGGMSAERREEVEHVVADVTPPE